MDLGQFFSNRARPVSASVYAIWLVWLPLSVINLSEAWDPHPTFRSISWLVVALVYAMSWPLITERRLADLGLSLLWLFPILLPLLVLMLAVCEKWRLVGAVALLVSLAAQAPLVWMSPRKEPATTKDGKADRPTS